MPPTDLFIDYAEAVISAAELPCLPETMNAHARALSVLFCTGDLSLAQTVAKAYQNDAFRAGDDHKQLYWLMVAEELDDIGQEAAN